MWSPLNMDASQEKGFARDIYSYDCSYVSWGNLDARNSEGTSFLPYQFNAATYQGTPGSLIEYPNGIEEGTDVARLVCGVHWRIPTSEEFLELLENTDIIDMEGNVITEGPYMIQVNDVRGLLLKSKTNNSRLFLPCCGYGSNSNLQYRGSTCEYWSSKLADQSQPLRLDATNSAGASVKSTGFQRYLGLAVRPIYVL